MDKDLGIDKLDDKKGLKRIFDKVEKSRCQQRITRWYAAAVAV
jgi:hypothetical protein